MSNVSTPSTTAVVDDNSCQLASLDECQYRQDDSNAFETMQYCCNYFAGPDYDLFTNVKLVRDLNVICLIIDYVFVLSAALLLWYFWHSDRLKECKKWLFTVTCTGAIIDIALTFTVVQIIKRNELPDTFGALFDNNCYSDTAALTMLTVQVDVLEGAVDSFGVLLVLIGYFMCNLSPIPESMIEGIHGFIFTLFDLTVISANVVLFVLPTYGLFVDVYKDNEFACFAVDGADRASIGNITSGPLVLIIYAVAVFLALCVCICQCYKWMRKQEVDADGRGDHPGDTSAVDTSKESHGMTDTLDGETAHGVTDDLVRWMKREIISEVPPNNQMG